MRVEPVPLPAAEVGGQHPAADLSLFQEVNGAR
jgi:hypothetical protein